MAIADCFEINIYTFLVIKFKLWLQVYLGKKRVYSLVRGRAVRVLCECVYFRHLLNRRQQFKRTLIFIPVKVSIGGVLTRIAKNEQNRCFIWCSQCFKTSIFLKLKEKRDLADVRFRMKFYCQAVLISK